MPSNASWHPALGPSWIFILALAAAILLAGRPQPHRAFRYPAGPPADDAALAELAAQISADPSLLRALLRGRSPLPEPNHHDRRVNIDMEAPL